MNFTIRLCLDSPHVLTAEIGISVTVFEKEYKGWALIIYKDINDLSEAYRGQEEGQLNQSA